MHVNWSSIARRIRRMYLHAMLGIVSAPCTLRVCVEIQPQVGCGRCLAFVRFAQLYAHVYHDVGVCAGYVPCWRTYVVSDVLVECGTVRYASLGGHDWP